MLASAHAGAIARLLAYSPASWFAVRPPVPLWCRVSSLRPVYSHLCWSARLVPRLLRPNQRCDRNALPSLAWLQGPRRGLSANKSHEVNDAGQVLEFERVSDRFTGLSSQQLAGDRSTVCGELFMLGARAHAQTSGYCIEESDRPSGLLTGVINEGGRRANVGIRTRRRRNPR